VYRFEGTALEGFISVKALCSHEGESHKFDLTFNVEAWKGKNLLELPRFSRLLKAAKLMAEGRLVFEFEVGSDAAAFDSTVSAGTENFHELLQWIIFYLDVARKIAERCHEPILLKEVDFDYDLYVEMKKYAKLFPGPIYTHRTPGMLCEGRFDYYEGFTLDSFGVNGFPNSVKLLQQSHVLIKLLGTSIRAPRIESFYTNTNTIFFSDIEDRTKPRLEIHTTPATDIMIQIHPEDAWVVLEEQEAPTVTD
jgi:hypothetical protein